VSQTDRTVKQTRTRPLRIALLGCGVVGTAVARLLTDNAGDLTARIGCPLEIVGVAVRRPDKNRSETGVDASLFTTDAEELVTRADVVIEVVKQQERLQPGQRNELFADLEREAHEMRDLITWIGADAVRYSLARYPADSPISLVGEELRKRTNDNPVFYVQYAHARTCNVTRLAAEDGVHLADGFDPSLLTHESEAALLAILGDFPRIVAQAAKLREPHRVARYLEDLAGRFHKWYDDCRVRPREADEEITDLHRTRLCLNEATRVVLANGLGLLGVSAPERL